MDNSKGNQDEIRTLSGGIQQPIDRSFSNYHTADLLNPGRLRNLDKHFKENKDIMKTYDLNEENLRNLKQLRKYSLF